MKDPAVRALSLESRGLWIDMICVAHESKSYGHLSASNGVPLDSTEIARIVGAPLRKVKRCLAEMERVGTFSRSEDGIIYSRRMVRDRELRETRRRCGRLGGNPKLVKVKLNQIFNQNLTPSSSSSSSEEKPPLTPPDKPNPEEGWPFDEKFLELWSLYHQKGQTRRIEAERIFCNTFLPLPDRDGEWQKAKASVDPGDLPEYRDPYGDEE